MRKLASMLAIASVVALTGCAKKTPPPVVPAPPAAPATPPPAPPPEDVIEPSAASDEYTRLRSLAADELERLGLLQEIHFDFDQAHIRDDAKPLLARNADVLRRFDFIHVTIEGHCDARGTVEYNLALGERRAQAAHEYLVSLGVPSERLRTASYGKEAPLCSDSTEDCWARNRRGKLTVTGTARQH